jgi:aspartate kinase
VRVAVPDYESVPALAGEEARTRAGTVVMKFGGTSVGDPKKLKSVARRLAAAREAGNRVVAVLSAMGSTTDELVALAHQISPHPNPRELDMLQSVGERISCSLAAMAIHDLGHEAISLTGSQAGIVTDTVHGKAKIVDVRARRIHEALDDDRIVLVAGFQGVSTATFDITTLGRGGSDTTAVALAAALGAEACEIYTDVDGVYTADPRIVPEARKLHAVSYDEMLEMAASGAKVLQLRSVEFARNHGVKLHVRSAFTDDEGTWVREEDERMLEKAMISGVTHTREETLYWVEGAAAATLFDALAEATVNVDTIVQIGPEIVFSAPNHDHADVAAALDRLGVSYRTRDDLARVSVVGAGMKSHPGIAAKAFTTLDELGIQTQVVTTSPIKISCHVATEDVERAVKGLHDAFELDRADAERAHE